MKILMTMIMTMLVATSVYAADCKKEGDSCTKEECTKLGAGLSVNEGGKCVKVAASQNSDTSCASIVSTQNKDNTAAGAGSKSATADDKTK